MVKKLPANAGDIRDTGSVPPGKIPRRRKRQLTPLLLPGESHGQSRLVGYSPRATKSWTRLKRLSTPLEADGTSLNFGLGCVTCFSQQKISVCNSGRGFRRMCMVWPVFAPLPPSGGHILISLHFRMMRDMRRVDQLHVGAKPGLDHPTSK